MTASGERSRQSDLIPLKPLKRRRDSRIARSTPSGGSSRPGSSPASRGSCATSASPRSSRRTRSSPRSSSGPSRASRTIPGAWLMATAKHRAHRPSAPEQAARAQARGARSRARSRRSGGRSRISTPRSTTTSATTCCASIFTACHPVLLDRGARRADAAAARRADDRRDRARVPRPGADDRAADRARQADARRGARPVRGPARRRSVAARLSSVLEVVYLDLQRGLRGDRRRRLDAAGALRGRAPARPHPRRARAGRAGGARPRRADGDPGVARARARRPVRRADPAPRAEPRALGPAAHRPRPRRARRAPRRSGGALGPYALQAAIAACHARRPTAGRDGLGAHRRALRRARRSSRHRRSSS